MKKIKSFTVCPSGDVIATTKNGNVEKQKIYPAWSRTAMRLTQQLRDKIRRDDTEEVDA